MIDVIKMDNELFLCVKDPQAFCNITNDAIAEFSQRFHAEGERVFDLAAFDAAVGKIVCSVLQQEHPQLVPMLHTRVIRSPSDAQRGTLILGVNAAYKTLLTATPGVRFLQ